MEDLVTGGEKRETEMKDGKLEHDTIAFVEMLNFRGNELRVTYRGQVTGDEITFTREIGDFAKETLVARRDPDYETLSVMNYVLGGGGFSSRLMDRIRTQAGLAYSVGSGLCRALLADARTIAHLDARSSMPRPRCSPSGASSPPGCWRYTCSSRWPAWWVWAGC